MLGLMNAGLGRDMRHGAPLDTELALEPVQSMGHARNFEKLPKFQRLVVSGGGSVGSRDRHDLLAGRQELPVNLPTMRSRAGIPIIRVPRMAHLAAGL